MKNITSKQFLFFLILIFISSKSFSQIQGNIVDNNNRPLPFANVLLVKQNDSTLVTGVMAKQEGTYSITNFKPGNYIVEIRMLGYKSAYSEPFTIKVANSHFHMETIIAEEDSRELGDVNIIAKKPIYELKIDRAVINVENSVTSTGTTALEVLEKSPGVLVDRQNNNISLSGKSGVMVIINGKQTRMPIAAAFQMLDAMSADNVKKIELITTPPARYEAEGDAGIINIVLKKNEEFGTNGSFTLGAGMANKERFNGNLNLNHHIDQVNFYGTYSTSYENKYQVFDIYRTVPQDNEAFETTTLSLRDPELYYQNARLGFDYTITGRTTIGVLLSGYIRHWVKNDFNSTNYKRNNASVGSSEVNVSGYDKWMHGMGNFYVQHHFQEDEILDINFDYLRYDNRNPTYYKVDNKGDSGLPDAGEEIDIKKETPINFYVASMDYALPVNDNLKIEAGAKITFSNFFNDVNLSYLHSGNWELDGELSNKYTMNENISAVYSSLNYKLGAKTSIAAGLRYEYLNSVLDSETEEGIIDLHYGRLFPTLYVSQEINEKNKVQFSYGKRIDRPTFNELAPFITFVSPELLFSGNAELLPAISNIYKADYILKSVVISVSYTDTKNAISRFQPTLSQDNIKLLYVSKNLDRKETVSTMIALPVRVNDWWNMRYNFNWVYQKMETNYEGKYLERNKNSYNVNTVQSLNLSKLISAEFTGFYRSRSFDGVSVRKASGKLDIGIQMKFKNEKSKLNFNVSDVFKTNVMRFEADIPELNIFTNESYDMEPRVARLTFTQNFGSTSIKSSRKRNTASEEERKRVRN